ncbi:MAG TPA: hypothetical protein VE553_08840 [Candidatus Binatia bacterium]|nr:hypothetical protein [Candidatus Binatia bacterium]
MKRILIVESDEELRNRLSEAVMAVGDYQVSQAITVREACLLIAQKPHHLAILPAADAPSARRALHALQPDLPLGVVTTGEAESPLDQDGGAIRGIISAEHPQEGLRELLEQAAPEEREALTNTMIEVHPERPPDDTVVSTPSLPEMPEEAPSEEVPADDREFRLRQALEDAADNDKILGAVLASPDAVIMHGGALSGDQVEAIADRVSQTWREDSSALLQFMRPPDRSSDLLLFTRPTLGAQLLTLAAAPDLNLARLRRVADAVVSELAHLDDAESEGASESDLVDKDVFHTEPAAGDSFALLFQARRPLPPALQTAVGEALQEVASAAGCTLLYQQVAADLVHLVTSCPGQRGSGWLAHLYKQGIEERIQAKFGVPAHLWRRGFYATESERPLSDVELKLFAEH